MARASECARVLGGRVVRVGCGLFPRSPLTRRHVLSLTAGCGVVGWVGWWLRAGEGAGGGAVAVVEPPCFVPAGPIARFGS
jgi:hypothetical protein